MARMPQNYQIEDTTMVVFLEELVFPFGRLVGDELGIHLQLLSPLLLCHVAESVDLLLFSLVSGKDGLKFILIN